MWAYYFVSMFCMTIYLIKNFNTCLCIKFHLYFCDTQLCIKTYTIRYKSFTGAFVKSNLSICASGFFNILLQQILKSLSCTSVRRLTRLRIMGLKKFKENDLIKIPKPILVYKLQKIYSNCTYFDT